MEVRETILKCTPKSSEADPLPISLLREMIDEIVPLPAKLFHASLSSGVVPSAFKGAKVRPLLKKAGLDSNVFKNYRPVSNLPFLSKIFEKIVLARLSRHLVGNGLLEPLQSGYRSNHSTETALLKLVNDLLCSADEGKVSVLALLDLSSAFDTIDHEVLLKRLHDTYGIEGTVLNWFHSYLSERTKSVSFCGCASRAHQLLYGVPQGSVLGPVLFC